MQIYKIEIKKCAQKFIRKQDADTQKRLYKAIYKLPAGDIKKLSSGNVYRLRVGGYRIIYFIDEAVRIINVESVGNRGQVYNRI